MVLRSCFARRTAHGSKLNELTINHSVVFEVDAFTEETGWSVVLRGVARVLEHEAEILEAEVLPLHPLVPTLKPVFVKIEDLVATGRSFVFGPEPDREAVQEG